MHGINDKLNNQNVYTLLTSIEGRTINFLFTYNFKTMEFQPTKINNLNLMTNILDEYINNVKISFNEKTSVIDNLPKIGSNESNVEEFNRLSNLFSKFSKFTGHITINSDIKNINYHCNRLIKTIEEFNRIYSKMNHIFDNIEESPFKNILKKNHNMCSKILDETHKEYQRIYAIYIQLQTEECTKNLQNVRIA